MFSIMKSRPKVKGFEKSTFLQLCLEEKEEIRRYKKKESEKAGCDIGYDRALLEWIRYHRDSWYRARVHLVEDATNSHFLHKFA